jgi:hypothetical protein
MGVPLRNGDIYDVMDIDFDGTPIVGDEELYFNPPEMQYVERVTDEEDTERNAELGEPSADCNCVTLSEIYDEIVDMKAMIGRLIRNGGDNK